MIHSAIRKAIYEAIKRPEQLYFVAENGEGTLFAAEGELMEMPCHMVPNGLYFGDSVSWEQDGHHIKFVPARDNALARTDEMTVVIDRLKFEVT